jgi:putative effector of murein hydrolase
MKALFHYCVYRIAYTYKKLWMKDYIGQGYFLMFFAFTCYALAFTVFFLSLFDMKVNKTIAIVFCIPIAIEVLFIDRIFPKNRVVYREYNKKYRHEKFRWIKGLLVFLFVALAFPSFIAALFMFG